MLRRPIAGASLTLLCTAALLAGLAACAPTQQPPPPQSARPEAKPAGPSEWVVAVQEEAANLDPGSGASIAASTQAQLLIFDPLLNYEAPNFKAIGLVAESWSLLDDQTWEFKLRRGVKFHNGDDLTAADVVYSFDVYRQPTSGRQFNLASVASAEQVDPYTVRITTVEPTATLLANLATLPILPREAREQVGPERFELQPVGSGPFKFVEFVRGQHLVIEANPTYWGGRVAPARVTLRPIADPTTRAAELKVGATQIIVAPSVVQLKELQTSDLELLPMKGARLITHSFNTTTKPFDDIRVRQAANYAVDRETIVKSVLEGYGELLHGPFSSSWLGYDPSLRPYAYDPARAKQLLAEAGYPNGFDTVFNYSSGVFLKDREIAEVVASQLAQVGIRARLIPTERAKIQGDWLNGTFEGITTTQWPIAADPDPMLGWTFYKRKGHAPDDRLNALIDQSRSTVDPEARKRILQEFGRYVHDQAYWLFIHAQDEFWAKRKDVPWQLSPMHTVGQMRYWFKPGP